MRCRQEEKGHRANRVEMGWKGGEEGRGVERRSVLEDRWEEGKRGKETGEERVGEEGR